MNRKERRNQIKTLKKTNSAFSKGAVWTKLAVALCLLMIAAIQGYMYWTTKEIMESAMIHLVVQSLTVLLILRGGKLMPWVYGGAMLVSLGLACWLNLQNESVFYQAQMVFFLSSFLVMLFLICNASARVYRNELASLKKKKAEPVIESVVEEHEENEVQDQQICENQEFIEEDSQKQSHAHSEGAVKVVQNDMLQVSCPPSVQLNYGSFSRFLVQHYPFVYLHPKFDLESSPWVQMCISAEGFDKLSDDLYSGEFMVHQSINEHERMLWIEYTDEMSHLCALICADWLVMQKGTLLQDGINVSQQLMKQLTESFVLAKDAEKKPFEGFKKRL